MIHRIQEFDGVDSILTVQSTVMSDPDGQATRRRVSEIPDFWTISPMSLSPRDNRLEQIADGVPCEAANKYATWKASRLPRPDIGENEPRQEMRFARARRPQHKTCACSREPS